MRYLVLLLLVSIQLAFTSSAHAHGRHIAVVGMPIGFSMPAVLHDWSQGNNVHLYAKPSCEGQDHCITVTALPMGGNYVGYAWVRNYTDGTTRSVIHLNSRERNGHVRHQAACHEIGHALFLPHSNVGCMREVVTGEHKRPIRQNLLEAA